MELGEVVNMPGDHAATHRDQDTLEKWADMHFKKDKNDKCKVPHLKRNNPRNQASATQLENSLAEKDPGALADTKLNMRNQCALAKEI